MIEIKHWSGRVLHIIEADTVRAAVIALINQGVDLQDANLRGANLDYSYWPFRCGSFNAKADDRLVARMFAHLTRLNVSGCSGRVREAMEHLRQMALTNLFCEYQDTVKII